MSDTHYRYAPTPCYAELGIPTATAFRSGQNKKTQKRKTEPMKTMKNLTIATLAATLLFQTPIALAGVGNQVVAPSNSFVVLLEGTFEPAGVVPDLGLVMPHLNNGIYKKVPIYNIDNGIPGPTDKAVGTFYALGGEMLFAYDLRMGALTAMMTSSNTVTTSDGAGGIFISGTYELDILEATGIYKSFGGGHIHMVDILHRTAAGVFIEHCFCYISKKYGKP
jgi:hypothetical protein